MANLLRQAYSSLAKNRLQEASDIARSLLERDPEDHRNWALLRDINARANRHQQAIVAARRVIELKPADTEALVGLSRVLINAGSQSEAITTLARISVEEITQARINDVIGALYAMCDEPLCGLPFARAAAAAAPDNPVFISNLAMIQRSLGHFAAAESNFDSAIDLNPHEYRAYHTRSDLKTWTRQDNHIPQIERLLKAQIKDWRGETAVRFALAKEYEDLEDFDDAFGALKSANDLQRRHTRYEVADDVAAMDQIIGGHTSATLERLPEGGTSAEPIFVLGLPRSGTTLVERILGSHSQVYAAGELNNFAMQLVQAGKQMFGEQTLAKTELIDRALELDMQALGDAYVQSTRPRTGHSAHFIDKLPMNYLYCGLIHAALPNARIILLRRSPMDTCFAMYRMMFLNAYPFSYDLEDIGAYYLAWHRLVGHWKQVLGSALHIVNYETLTGDAETQTRLLLDYCNLDWEDNCLDFHSNAAPSTTASAVQVRRKIYTSSVGKWKRYERQLQPLYQQLRDGGVLQPEGA